MKKMQQIISKPNGSIVSSNEACTSLNNITPITPLWWKWQLIYQSWPKQQLTLDQLFGVQVCFDWPNVYAQWGHSKVCTKKINYPKLSLKLG
jgi:hypothetical protein